jgi:hypothetical protein
MLRQCLPYSISAACTFVPSYLSRSFTAYLHPFIVTHLHFLFSTVLASDLVDAPQVMFLSSSENEYITGR